MGWFNHQLVIVEKTQKPPGFDGSEDKISMTELHDKVAHMHWGAATTQMTRDYGLVELVGRLVIS